MFVQLIHIFSFLSFFHSFEMSKHYQKTKIQDRTVFSVPASCYIKKSKEKDHSLKIRSNDKDI